MKVIMAVGVILTRTCHLSCWCVRQFVAPAMAKIRWARSASAHKGQGWTIWCLSLLLLQACASGQLLICCSEHGRLSGKHPSCLLDVLTQPDGSRLSAVNRTFSYAELQCSFSSSRLVLTQQKDKLPLLTTSMVIYSFRCACGATYIGRTARQLSKWISEHQSKWVLTEKSRSYH